MTAAESGLDKRMTSSEELEQKPYPNVHGVVVFLRRVSLLQARREGADAWKRGAKFSLGEMKLVVGTSVFVIA